MKIIRKKPGMQPEFLVVENTLESLQEQVGGYIEAVTFCDDCCVICNEEGRLLSLAPNCTLFGIDFVGTVLIVGCDGEEFTDVPRPELLLELLFGLVRYRRLDRRRFVWECCGCGHIEQFEADGPYENGWNVCPSCGRQILLPEEA